MTERIKTRATELKLRGDVYWTAKKSALRSYRVASDLSALRCDVCLTIFCLEPPCFCPHCRAPLQIYG